MSMESARTRDDQHLIAEPSVSDLFAAILDDDPPPAPHPVEAAAEEALAACLQDKQRVRTARVGAEMFVFVVTSRPADGGSGPIVHSGCEPTSVIDQLDDLVRHRGFIVAPTAITGRYEQKCWALPLSKPRLIRLWSRKAGEERDSGFLYYGVTMEGVVKQISPAKYGELKDRLFSKKEGVR